MQTKLPHFALPIISLRDAQWLPGYSPRFKRPLELEKLALLCNVGIEGIGACRGMKATLSLAPPNLKPPNSDPPFNRFNRLDSTNSIKKIKAARPMNSGALSFQTPRPNVDKALLDILFLAYGTDQGEIYYETRKRLNKAVSEFDALCDSAAEWARSPGHLLDNDLAEIGRDRRLHPDLYRNIESGYLFKSSGKGSEVRHPPNLVPAHLTKEYRLVWEYYCLSPLPYYAVPGFGSLADEAFTLLAGPQKVRQVYLDVALTLASTTQKSVFIEDKIILAIGALCGAPSFETLKKILYLGAVWNEYHLSDPLRYLDTFEERVAAEIHFELAGFPDRSWSRVWPQRNQLHLTKEERAVLSTIEAEYAKINTEGKI